MRVQAGGDAECVECIGQTVRAHEVVVVDDGSTTERPSSGAYRDRICTTSGIVVLLGVDSLAATPDSWRSSTRRCVRAERLEALTGAGMDGPTRCPDDGCVLESRRGGRGFTSAPRLQSSTRTRNLERARRVAPAVRRRLASSVRQSLPRLRLGNAGSPARPLPRARSTSRCPLPNRRGKSSRTTGWLRPRPARWRLRRLDSRRRAQRSSSPPAQAPSREARSARSASGSPSRPLRSRSVRPFRNALGARFARCRALAPELLRPPRGIEPDRHTRPSGRCREMMSKGSTPPRFLLQSSSLCG